MERLVDGDRAAKQRRLGSERHSGIPQNRNAIFNP